MKRIISAFMLAAAIILLSGCDGGLLPGSTPPDLSKPFELTAKIEQDDFDATAEVTRTAADNWEFVFTEPKNISGLTVKIEDGIYKASLDDLTLETEDNNSVYSTIPSLIAEAVDAASEADGITVSDKNGTTVVTGNAGKYAYSIDYSRAENEITKLNIPSQKLSVTFESGVSAETESDTQSAAQ